MPGAYGLRPHALDRSRFSCGRPCAHGVWCTGRAGSCADSEFHSRAITDRRTRRDSVYHSGAVISTGRDPARDRRSVPDISRDADADASSEFGCAADPTWTSCDGWLSLLRSSAALHHVRRLCRARPAAGGTGEAHRERRGRLPAHRIDHRVSGRNLVLPLVREPTQGDRLRRHRRRGESHSHPSLQIACRSTAVLYFRGSSAGFTYAIPVGPMPCTCVIVTPFAKT